MALAASNRLSLAAYRAQAGLGPVEAAPRHKYAAKPTMGPDGAGGIRRYPSKLGAHLARRLEEGRQTGMIIWWAPEVSIPIGIDEKGKAVRIVIDALVCWASGRVEWLEAKGRDLDKGRVKRAVVRDRFGVDVRVLTAAEING